MHFTAEDVARTALCADADPLWEVLLSGFRMRERSMPLSFRPWLNAVTADADRSAAVRRGSRALRTLAPMGPYFPDFLTPAAARLGLDQGLEALLSTPRRDLRTQLRRLDRWRRLPDWAWPLAEGDPGVLDRLASALRGYHDAVVAPHRDLVGRSVAADHAHRLAALTEHGLTGLFDSMRPLLCWRPPVLEIAYAVDRELHLDGRGLRLVPSYFCHRVPVALADASLPPTLVYPIGMQFRWHQARRAAPSRSLEALLGTTRCAVLETIANGASTSRIAGRLDTSVSSVSRHAAVLRDAGLIASHRRDQSVVHSLTPLGAALLDGN
ncbi:winged helix-turn-helix domain-containing protein [Actinoplanes sp. NBRC 103695]|uniref:ArsR/SmtB family transcription factor n=1 Tax=Actinoplanes sp. NBRC 103695 TaxID=3032202 RepID=UPI0025521346|nr:winged helix-turn-helix domain-containing protein [Actinoplanes sp. NBRC 103695]